MILVTTESVHIWDVKGYVAVPKPRAGIVLPVFILNAMSLMITAATSNALKIRLQNTKDSVFEICHRGKHSSAGFSSVCEPGDGTDIIMQRPSKSFWKPNPDRTSLGVAGSWSPATATKNINDGLSFSVLGYTSLQLL
jgi:hypothetical protein